MSHKDFIQFSFTILFTDVKTLTGALTPFLYYRHRLESFLVQSHAEQTIANWFDPPKGGRHFPSFFVGKLISSRNSPAALFVSNLADGWTTGARKLSQTSRCRSIQIALSQNYSFPLFKYEVIDSGNTTRLVQLYKEDKWQFFEKGDPLSYEDVEAYRARKKSDRLSNQMIIAYLESEGIDFQALLQQSYEGILYKQLAW